MFVPRGKTYLSPEGGRRRAGLITAEGSSLHQNAWLFFYFISFFVCVKMMWSRISDVILFFHKKGINEALADIYFRSFDAKAKLTSGKEELKT